VTKGWVEIDAAGVPQRELGFDNEGQAIAAAPFGKNFGFFTDTSTPVFDPGDFREADHPCFEAAWAEFESRWQRCD
jgi:hypothetical protein